MFNTCMAMFDPFRTMDDFNSSYNGFGTDVTDEGSFYKLTADLPGFEKEDIHIATKDNILTITAERHDSSEKSDKKGRYIRRERSYGSFQRSFDLSDVNENAVGASYENGVLTVTLPKAQKPEGHTITVE